MDVDDLPAEILGEKNEKGELNSTANITKGR